jgi:hypothetical protein
VGKFHSVPAAQHAEQGFYQIEFTGALAAQAGVWQQRSRVLAALEGGNADVGMV